MNRVSPWGRQCKIQRVALDMSLEDIARAIGKSRIYVSQIICGLAFPNKDVYDAISEVLHVDPDLPKYPVSDTEAVPDPDTTQ